jgi:BCD family chlorophyll transporter-like MFS transporter
MLDMTTADKVGLFIGAWGMANAISRLIGSILGGMVRDLVTQIVGNAVIGYALVFGIMAVLMLASLLMLRRVDTQVFRQEVKGDASLIERVAVASEAS